MKISLIWWCWFHWTWSQVNGQDCNLIFISKIVSLKVKYYKRHESFLFIFDSILDRKNHNLYSMALKMLLIKT